MSGSIARRIRMWAATLVAVSGSATMQANADTFDVKGSCGDDAWSGTSSVCSAPNGPSLTIQTSIDASVAGDMVRWSTGCTTASARRIWIFGGKAISVGSECGPAAGIVDCENDGRGFFLGAAVL